MELRDKFAARAMQALIAQGYGREYSVTTAYELADAMMRQRAMPSEQMLNQVGLTGDDYKADYRTE
jgi:hypothetical protein